jgi:hypothetical protein
MESSGRRWLSCAKIAVMRLVAVASISLRLHARFFGIRGNESLKPPAHAQRGAHGLKPSPMSIQLRGRHDGHAGACEVSMAKSKSGISALSKR